MKRNCIIAALFLPVSFLFSTTNAIWQGPSGSNWSAAGSWSASGSPPSTPPTAPGDSAAFNNTGPGVVNVDAGMTGSVGTISLDSSTAYTISSSSSTTLTLNSGSASTAAAIKITTVNGAGAHTISTTLGLQSGLTVSQGSSADFTISGVIQDGTSPTSTTTLSLIGTSSGRLVLSSSTGNTYSGGTAISSGILSVSAENQLGSTAGNINIGSGTLQYTNTAAVTSTHNIQLSGGSIIDTSGTASVTIGPGTALSGAGSLTKVGSQTLILAGANTYSSGTTVSAGTLSISNDNQLGATTGSLNLGTATLVTTAAITSARSGTITGSPATLNTMGFTDTFTGNFGGGGTLAITGGGTVILTGKNSYSGGTTVTASNLQGNTNGVQGPISIDGASNLTFTQTFNGTYSGALSGAGALALPGSGTITFSGNSSSFTGATSLTGGGLFVNGSLASSAVTTAAGTTLGGSGTIGATNNSGTLRPGSTANGIGKLSVNGNLTLAATSNVNINLNTTSASSIGVAGTATINGALTVNPTPGFYGFSASYTILTSAGLLNVPPGFTSVTSTNSAFTPTVTYNTPLGSIVLNVKVLTPFILFPFSNENTRAVGTNIDALSAAGQLTTDLFNVFQSFTTLTNAQINAALDEMHPAPYSAFTESLAVTDSKLISLFHRLPYFPSYPERANRLWAEPFGNWLNLKNHGIQFGAQTTTEGVAAGYDREVSDPLYLGIGGAWSHTNLNWKDQHGHGHVNQFIGCLYADYQLDAFYLGGAFFAGVDYFDTSRHLHFGTTNRHAEADFSALDLVAQLQTAYLFGSPLAYFYPYANFDFIYLRTKKFREQGAGGLDLTVNAHSNSTFRTEMGLALQVQDTNAAETMTISPMISLGWVNMVPIQREDYTAHFVGTTIPFTTDGWDHTWNLFEVDFGLGFTFYNFGLSFEYNVELSPDHHTILFNQYANANLSLEF